VLPWQAGANVAFTRVRKRAKLAVARRVQCGVGQAEVRGRLTNEGQDAAVHGRNLHREAAAKQRRWQHQSVTSMHRLHRSVMHRPLTAGMHSLPGATGLARRSATGAAAAETSTKHSACAPSSSMDSETSRGTRSKRSMVAERTDLRMRAWHWYSAQRLSSPECASGRSPL
jgi:hypothetical protein